MHMDIFRQKISQELLDIRIMKFGTKLWYDKLYCVTKNQPHIAYPFLYFFIFLSLQQKIMSQILQLSVEARVFRFCIHLESG